MASWGSSHSWSWRSRSRALSDGARRALASTYAITALVSQYLKLFVLIVQLFLRVPAMHALAPEGGEPPFAITQGIVLVLFVVLGTKAVGGFRAA